MAENSHIEWCDHTFNPWWGCCKVSKGCEHCYADTLANRFKGKGGEASPLKLWGPNATRQVTGEHNWKQPILWNKKAKAEGKRARVFCASMSDVFEGPETCQDPAAYAAIVEARRRLFVLIEQTTYLDWLLLTKRPENILKFAPVTWGGYLGGVVGQTRWPNHVWVGTSVEDQKTADERIPYLNRVPAAVRFLSIEPLIGPVSLDESFYCCKSCGFALGFFAEDYDEESATEEEHAAYVRFSREGCAHCGAKHGYYAITEHTSSIDWVIVGGESGPHARPMNPDWARSLRDQCQLVNVPFFFKQWGEWLPFSHGGEGEPREHYVDYLNPHGRKSSGSLHRVGKKLAGRKLDGRTWDELPEVNR